jgi:hypothetical protein
MANAGPGTNGSQVRPQRVHVCLPWFVRIFSWLNSPPGLYNKQTQIHSSLFAPLIHRGSTENTWVSKNCTRTLRKIFKKED